MGSLNSNSYTKYIGVALFGYAVYYLLKKNKNNKAGSPEYDTYTQDDLSKQKSAVANRCANGDYSACVEFAEKWDADAVPITNPFR
jgi:hypothetical protein